MQKQQELVNFTHNKRAIKSNAIYPEMRYIYKDWISDVCRVFDSYVGDTAACDWLNRGSVLPAPSFDLSHFDFYTQAQRKALLSKGFCVKPKLDPEALAIETFQNCEARNRETNQKFRTLSFSFEERSLLERARAICQRIMGKTPTRLHLSFTTGASVLLPAKEAHFINKMSSPLEVSTTSILAVRRALQSSGLFQVHLGLCQDVIRRHRGHIEFTQQDFKYVLVEHTELFFVDKTFEQKRICMKERSGDMLVQRGIGRCLADRTSSYSSSLYHRPSKHKWLVEKHFTVPYTSSARADLDYIIATIDVKNASNSLSYEMVKFFLSQDWFDLLSSVRSRSFTYPNGDVGRFEMFSSNGNGYTFELETIIFESLALAIREVHGTRWDRVSVFGDDIIVADYLAEPLIQLLNCCGFETNNEKSYFGPIPFRESCGYDCYKGKAARPVYFKGNPDKDDWVKLLYTFANNLIKLHEYWPIGSILDIHAEVVDSIPPSLRVGGPSWLGDTVLHGLPPSKDKYGRQLHLVPYSSKILPQAPDALLAYAVNMLPSSGISARASIPNGYRVVVLDNGWKPEADYLV